MVSFLISSVQASLSITFLMMSSLIASFSFTSFTARLFSDELKSSKIIDVITAKNIDAAILSKVCFVK